MSLNDMKNLHLLLLSLLVFALSCISEPKAHRCSGAIWATSYNITYTAPTYLTDSILATFDKVEHSLSPFAKSSLISRINRNESMETDSLLRCVFEASLLVNSASSGAFDPTISPLVNLWGFGYKNATEPPTQAMIDSALNLVGINRCRIEADTMIKASPDMEFNFSAITKGYGCDLVGEVLERNGATDYMVEIGGEIALKGHNPQGNLWNIQIDAPIESKDASQHTALKVIQVTDCGIATSGNYRNYKETATGRTWHTIDPRTGRPVITSTLSATVIAPNCMLADALATACMAMPAPEAIKMIEAIPGASAMLVEAAADSAFAVTTTSRFPELH